MSAQQEHAQQQRLWSTKDLADYLGPPVTVRTIYKWTFAGTAPRHYRVGRHLKFDPTDVADWLREHRVEPRGAER